jgi:hypothetical protein
MEGEDNAFHCSNEKGLTPNEPKRRTINFDFIVQNQLKCSIISLFKHYKMFLSTFIIAIVAIAAPKKSSGIPKVTIPPVVERLN